MDEDNYDTEDLEDMDTKVDSTMSQSPNYMCCISNCLKMFDEEFKSRLKYEMSLLSKSEKRIYLFAMISIKDGKHSNGTVLKFSKMFEYTVKEYGVSRLVCKTAFVVLHDSSMSMIRTLCNKMCAKFLIPTDERGKHNNKHALPEDMQELIRIHFLSILESPAVFQCAKKRLGKPNIQRLWLSFTSKYGHVARSTYSKYLTSVLTQDNKAKFMHANQARLILEEIRKFEQ